MPFLAEVGYSAVHWRLRKIKGRAADHPCVDCGEPARQWSYDGTDPDERTEAGLRYSLDLARYVARCSRCHARHDWGQPTQCKHGHPLTGPDANVRIDKRGHWVCRPCMAMYQTAAWKARRRASLR